MTTAKPFFNFNFGRFFSCYKDVLRRHVGAGLFYGVLGFIFLPLQYILTILKCTNSELPEALILKEFIGVPQCYNGVSAILFPFLTLVCAIVLPTTMFSYIQNKRAIDVYHSLPYTREELLVSTSAAGLTLIFIPMAINFGIVAAASSMVPGSSIAMIFQELLCWMLAVALTFFITVFASVQVGSIFEAYTFSVVLNASISAVYLVFSVLAETFLYGYSTSADQIEIAYKLSPVSMIIGRLCIASNDFERIAQNNKAFMIWAVLLIAVIIASIWMYKKRKSEKAGELGSMGPLSLYVRTVGTLVGGTFLGAMFIGFFNIQTNEKIAIIAVMAISSMIVYFVGDVTLSRTVKTIPKAVLPASLTSAGVCIFVGIMIFGGLGYETRVPNIDDVASVSMGNYRGGYVDLPTYKRSRTEAEYTSPEIIQAVTQAQQSQIQTNLDSQNSNSDPESYYNYRGIEFKYTLKSGATIKRHYRNLTAHTSKILSSIDVQDEFIQANHPIFNVDETDVTAVEHAGLLGDNEQEIKMTKADKKSLINALRADMLTRSLEDITSGKAIGKIMLELPTQRYIDDDYHPVYSEKMSTQSNSDHTLLTIYYTEEFKNTIAFIKSLGVENIGTADLNKIESLYIGLCSYGGGNYYCYEQANENTLYDLNSDIGTYNTPNTKSAWKKIDNQSDILKYYPSFVSAHDHSEPMAFVAVSLLGDSEKDVSSYFFIPLSVLGEDMSAELIENSYNINGEWSLRQNGIFLSPDQVAALDAKQYQ